MKITSSEKKWQEFLNWIDIHSENWYYRGHSDTDYLLQPTIGRESYVFDEELNMFEIFKLKSNLYFKNKSYNEFELLAMAQHHGLPTRLLDWSHNPIIAAYFSVTSSKNKIARIYAVKPEKFIDINNFESPFNIKDISFLYPPISTNRIELQKGIFSIHPLPDKPCIITGSETKITDDSDIHNSFLIEMEIAERKLRTSFAFFEFQKFNPNKDFSKEEQKKYILNYQNEYYQNYGGTLFNFDIPAEDKLYFERKIRKLGIDELIFGDIDSISSNIKYLKKNNLLNRTITPNKENSSAYLQNYVNDNILEYLKKGDTKLPMDLKFSLYNDDVSFYLEEISNFDTPRINLKGRLTLFIVPKFSIETDDVFYNFPKNNLLRKLYYFLRFVKSPISFIGGWQKSYNVEIIINKVSSNITKFAYLSIREMTFSTIDIREEMSEIEEINKKQEIVLKKVTSIIDKNDIEKIKILDSKTEEYKKLVKKYLNKVK